jgi:hypothetical protein
MAVDITRVLADIKFCQDNVSEFRGLCPLMRTVVALNPEMEAGEWADIAVAVGWNRGTALKQFAHSRRIDAETEAWTSKT